MAELGAFDRERITRDLEQLRELVDRKKAVREAETNEQRKAQLAAEIAQHEATITHLKAYL